MCATLQISFYKNNELVNWNASCLPSRCEGNGAAELSCSSIDAGKSSDISVTCCEYDYCNKPNAANIIQFGSIPTLKTAVYLLCFKVLCSLMVHNSSKRFAFLT